MLDKFLSKRRNIIFLAIVAVFMESLTSPCLKLGGRYPFLSAGYIAWFCLAVVILGFYAVCWQLILEKLPLTTAYLRPDLCMGYADLSRNYHLETDPGHYRHLDRHGRKYQR